MKRYISLLLTAALMLGVLSGCGNKDSGGKAEANADGFPIVDKTVTLDFMILKEAYHGDYAEMSFTKEYEKMTNVKINWQVVSNEEVASKKQLTLAGRDYPDAMFMSNTITSGDIVKYGAAGVLQPLGDKIKEYAPNLQKLIDENSDLKRALTAPDGKIYSLPTFSDRNTADLFTSKIYINTAWLKAVNMQKPTNYDELLAVLRAFKNNDPNKNGKKDEIPLVCDMFDPALAASPQGLHWNWLNDCMGIDANGKISFTFGSEQFRESLRFFRTLADEALMEEKTFKDGVSVTGITNTSNDNVGMFILQHGSLALPESKLDSFESCPPIQGYTGTAITPTNLQGQITPFWGVIPASNKNVEVTLRWLDYFYTTEGFIFKEYGPSGSDVIKKMPSGKYQDLTTDGQAKFKVAPGWVLPGFNSKAAADMFTEKATTTAHDTWYRNIDVKQVLPSYEKFMPKTYIPYLFFSEKDANRMQSLRDGILNYAKTTSINFVYRQGALNLDTGWNTYITELDKLGMTELVGYYQTAYDKFMK